MPEPGHPGSVSLCFSGQRAGGGASCGSRWGETNPSSGPSGIGGEALRGRESYGTDGLCGWSTKRSTTTTL